MGRSAVVGSPYYGVCVCGRPTGVCDADPSFQSSEVAMTPPVSVIAQIGALQKATDEGQDAIEEATATLQQFPHTVQLYGPVPDSGLWLDHLHTPGNELAVTAYQALKQVVTQLQSVKEARQAANRALEE